MRFKRVMQLGLALLIGGVAASWTPDAWITTKAKLALLTTAGVPASSVNIDTVDGRVTLHGKVPSTEQKAKAEEVTRKIDGVKDVRNLLQVVPENREKAVKASDSDLKDKVSDALKNDSALRDSSISVQSVNNGVVLLAGNAKRVTDHLRAVEDAWNVPGVQRVSSEIKSPDNLADDEIRNREQRRAAGDQPGAGGGGISDTWITTKAKMRLIADGNVPANDVSVDTNNGVVTLFGMVPNAKAKAAAEADARKVSGAKRVVNELQVVPSARQKTVKAHDDDIERQVKQALSNRAELKDSDIDVKVRNGVVRLSGTVPSEAESLSAAIVARSTAGVRSVQNDLHASDTARQERQGRID